MDRVSQEELISAYFDGDCTPEERQHAERLLGENAVARAWFAQLKSLRSDLQALPRQTIPADCSAAVLRDAECQMLVSGEGPLAKEPVVTPRVVQGLPPETHLRIWIALCVAAAALIVVVLPQYFRNHEPAADVAFHDADHDPAAIEGFAEEKVSKAMDRAEDFIPPIESKTEADRRPEATYFKQRGDRPAGLADGETESLKAGKDLAENESRKLATGKASGGAGGFGGGGGLGSPGGSGAALANNPLPDADGVAAGAPLPNVSYVYNVSSPEAQQVVLKKFEETLQEQQILLEDVPSAEAAQSQAGNSWAMGRQAGGAFGSSTPQRSKQQPEATVGDRVYLLEATPAQLSNTINTLDSYSVEPASERRERQLQEARPQLQAEKRLGSREEQSALARENPAKETPAKDAQSKDNLTQKPASELGINPVPNSANLGLQYRSQAVRLRSSFDDQTIDTNGYFFLKVPQAPAATAAAAPKEQAPAPKPTAGGAPPAASRPAPAPAPVAGPEVQSRNTPAAPPAVGRGLQQPLQNRSAMPPLQNAQNPEQAERLQRAVIIFRVVPEPASGQKKSP